jgi:hypothetical protein
MQQVLNLLIVAYLKLARIHKEVMRVMEAEEAEAAHAETQRPLAELKRR